MEVSEYRALACNKTRGSAKLHPKEVKITLWREGGKENSYPRLKTWDLRVP
jgi:hypothetical protein